MLQLLAGQQPTVKMPEPQLLRRESCRRLRA
jgi:hypothetical protein